MKALFVNEHNFERNKDPMTALNIGEWRSSNGPVRIPVSIYLDVFKELPIGAKLYKINDDTTLYTVIDIEEDGDYKVVLNSTNFAGEPIQFKRYLNRRVLNDFFIETYIKIKNRGETS